ncbi:prolyl oligopeptidase family serine peptidase [Pendulispora rubella]|uniref:Prolyl oligopeptidase family serine peptidase n=1 Tax=Pendulispora rubella TaxID=2741070 RepID=A0ABZ2L3W4_9BACT
MNERALLFVWSSVLLASCGGSPPEPAKTTTSASTPPASAPSLAPPARSEPTSGPVAADVPSGASAQRDGVLVSDAERIVAAFTNGQPSLSPDGKKVVFRSNRDGLPQLYLGDPAKPEAPAVRLTKTTERTVRGTFSADGKSVIFLSDRGADENFSIFRIGVDGSGLTELTPGESLHRDAPFVSDGAPDTLVYSARKNEEPTVRVYVQSIKGGAPPKSVYTDSLPGELLAVDRTAKRALLNRYVSSSQTTLGLVDLVTGKAKTIYPAEGKSAVIWAAAFSGDGKTLFVATDAGSEVGTLLALDAASLAERGRFVDASLKTAAIDELAVPRKGDRLAIRLNAGNRSVVRILDAKTLKPVADAKLPLGSGAGLVAGQDGKSFALHWSTPNQPADIFVVQARTGEARTAPKEARPTLAGLGELEATVQTIPSFDGTPLPLNVYKPKGLAAGSKKYPVLVSVHGGPSESSPVRWSNQVRFYTSHGFIVVEPNIRGSTGFGRAYEQADDGPKRMDAVKDIEAVGKWVVSNPWADPARLVLLGGSYGGYMTLMGLAHHPTLWKAGVDLVGVYDWRTLMRTTSGEIRAVFQKEIGPETDSAFLASISPSSRVDSIAVPLFVYAGANDPRVVRAESDQIVRSLRTRKVPVEYMVAENEGHSLDRKETITSFLARSTRFLEDALKLEKQ